MLERFDWGRILGVAGLLLLSWAYCQPGHPSAGRSWLLDAGLHVGLFGVVGFCWARIAGRGARATLALLALAVVLEVLQWWRGGYAALEYVDIACNVVGAWIGRWLAWIPAFAGMTARDQTARKLD